MKEYIICSANHYNDGKKHTHTPTNINMGFVVCGRRHHNCVRTFSQIVGFPYSESGLVLKKSERQGFLTNTNRFVEREEAAQIAFDYGQITQHKILLFSEDLY